MPELNVNEERGGNHVALFGSMLPQDERYVERSWERCRTVHKLDPGLNKDVPTLSHHELAVYEEEFGEIVPFAEHMLERLYRQIAGSGYVVVLTDKDGIVIRDVVDPICAKEIHKAGVRSGANWNEASQGTNAIGSAITELAPVIVHQDEHFVRRNHVLTCAAAPFFDPQGELLGILDATSPGHRTNKSQQIHTLALVLMTVRAIENRALSISHRNCRIVRLNKRVELIGLEDDSLFAVGENGVIEGINRRTAEIFIHDMKFPALVGQRIDQILDVRVEEIVSERRVAQLVRPVVCRRTGKKFYLAVEAHLQNAIIASSTPSVAPRKQGKGDAARFDLARLAGNDRSMQEVVATAAKVCDCEVPILFVGETGTGKGTVARAVHDASSRRDKPFVVVDCASIPESLIESELFGYRAGAFTGAERCGHNGLVKQSDGGTLFLDEIGDMPLDLQSRLLRALEEHEVRPLGSKSAVPVDLHAISATHNSLESMVRKGLFREDLYYRLNGVQLQVTALRDRSDIDDVIANILFDSGSSNVCLSEAARACLSEYHWPGNIRELRNVLLRAVALADSAIELHHLPDEIQQKKQEDRIVAGDRLASDSDTGKEGFDRLAATERQILLDALDKNRWHMTKTAASLDVSRSTLYRRMQKHGIAARPD